MKKLLLFPIALLLLIGISFAYELNIDSTTDSSIVLSFSNLNTLDVKFFEITATAETSTISDKYIVDSSLSPTSDGILLSVDISPLKEDYSQIDSILISGILESNGVQEPFSKRVSLRPESTLNRSMAPELSSSELIYWSLSLAILIVIMVILFIFLREPREIIIEKKVRKRKSKKKTKKKVKKKRL